EPKVSLLTRAESLVYRGTEGTGTRCQILTRDSASLWFAAEAAARHVPLKRQSRRQFTDTCRVAGLPADEGTGTRCQILKRSNVSLWFAAEAAARHVPLKRQSRRQFTDTCRVAGLPADGGTGRAWQRGDESQAALALSR